MARVTVRIPLPLRKFAADLDEVTVEGETVGEALAALTALHEELRERTLTPQGRPRRFISLFRNGNGLDRERACEAMLADGDVILIVPAVAGGAGTAKERRLAHLRATIPQVTPSHALTLQEGGAALIDVRERDEIAQGSPPRAYRLGRGYLELKAEEVVPVLDTPVITACDGGLRSLFAAEDLLRLGYTNVSSLAGGIKRWKDEGLPVEVPHSLDAGDRQRYSRHLLLPEVGEAGQSALLSAKVLLVGAGGLSSPAALYLAAAGVGTIGIVDDDVVDRTNLQRQILHSDDQVGKLKVESARARLSGLNPSINLDTYKTRLTSVNVEEIFKGYDLVVDGSDNFATRYLIGDACVKFSIPHIYGAVYRFEGQVSVFWPAYKKHPGPCYRCLYPEPPPSELAPSCMEAGVLGILPGVIGILQAAEAIKLIVGIGDPLVGRMLCYDVLEPRFTELALCRDPGCAYCAEGSEFPGFVDYAAFCSDRNPTHTP